MVYQFVSFIIIININIFILKYACAQSSDVVSCYRRFIGLKIDLIKQRSFFIRLNNLLLQVFSSFKCAENP